MVTNGHELFIPPKIKRSGAFKKGDIPWNKGTKGIMKRPVNAFKHGLVPHNAIPVGEIRLRKDSRNNRKYWHIFTGLRKPILLSHYIWQQHHGDIPKNMIIAFKDGDSLNCNIENLMMITRADNMRRNVNREKAAKSLSKLNHREKARFHAGLNPVSKIGINLKNKYYGNN